MELIFLIATQRKTFGSDVDNLEVITSDQGGSGAVVSMSKGLLLGALTFTSNSSTPPRGQVGAGGTVQSLMILDPEIGIATLSLAFFAKATENIATLRATVQLVCQITISRRPCSFDSSQPRSCQ